MEGPPRADFARDPGGCCCVTPLTLASYHNLSAAPGKKRLFDIRRGLPGRRVILIGFVNSNPEANEVPDPARVTPDTHCELPEGSLRTHSVFTLQHFDYPGDHLQPLLRRVREDNGLEVRIGWVQSDPDVAPGVTLSRLVALVMVLLCNAAQSRGRCRRGVGRGQSYLPCRVPSTGERKRQ